MCLCMCDMCGMCVRVSLEREERDSERETKREIVRKNRGKTHFMRGRDSAFRYYVHSLTYFAQKQAHPAFAAAHAGALAASMTL